MVTIPCQLIAQLNLVHFKTHDDASLSDISSELLASARVERSELEVGDLGPKLRRELKGDRSSGRSLK